MQDTFYITTPIYYVNDLPHIGHAYTTVAADTMARYMRLIGRDVYFLTGTDEHGQKVEKTAAERGMTNQQFVDSVAPRFRELCSVLGAETSDFIRTTEPRHKKAVRAMFERLREKGYIYKGEYEDWYCVPCESFWTSMQLDRGKCPDCGRDVDKLKEESYFFRLEQFGGEDGPLTRHLLDNPDFVMPKTRYNEVLSFVRSGLRDLSVSRTSFTWGIPVPGDERHVIYVWLDALTNYVSALGWPDEGGRFKKYWPADVHVIGKDILRFHAVYWPCFLMAAGMELPKRIFSHGWWTIDGEKMSKSRGNVVDPLAVVAELDEAGLGVDAFRYFLLREVPFGLDGDFSKDAMTTRINSDLANDLGNLHFRTINMIDKYLDGEVPIFAGGKPDFNNTSKEADKEYDLGWVLAKLADVYREKMDEMAFSEALQHVWRLISEANKYIDYHSPWALAKSNAEEDRAKLRYVLGLSAEVLKASAVLLHPFMPAKTQVIWEQLGHDSSLKDMRGLKDDFFVFEKGQKVKKVTKEDAPFPRIETERVKAKKAASKTAAGAAESGKKAEATPPIKEKGVSPAPETGVIKIDEFMKVELKAGRVLEAERVPKSDKLIKMKIDVGEDEPRQIVGGIGKSYSPEELVGKTVAVVANLKPAKLMGVVSQGMVLAAGGEDGLKLVGFGGEVAPGTRIK